MKRSILGDFVFVTLIPAPTGQFANLGNLDINNMIGMIITAVIAVAGVIFFFYFLLGGLRMILSGGKKENMDAARSHIVNAIIGLVIVLSAWAIASFVGGVFGVNLLTIPL